MYGDFEILEESDIRISLPEVGDGLGVREGHQVLFYGDVAQEGGGHVAVVHIQRHEVHEVTLRRAQLLHLETWDRGAAARK